MNVRATEQERRALERMHGEHGVTRTASMLGSTPATVAAFLSPTGTRGVVGRRLRDTLAQHAGSPAPAATSPTTGPEPRPASPVAGDESQGAPGAGGVTRPSAAALPPGDSPRAGDPGRYESLATTGIRGVGSP